MSDKNTLFFKLCLAVAIFLSTATHSHADEPLSSSKNSFTCDGKNLESVSKSLDLEMKSFERAYYSSFTNCHTLSLIHLLSTEKRLQIDDLKYEGGFKLSHEDTSTEDYASLRGSMGIFTFDERTSTVFVVGDPRGNGVAEFSLPEIVNSTNPNDFATGQVIQGFSRFHNTNRVNTGIDHYFRVTGLETIDNSLIVNYINWYDATGRETDTTVFFWNANNLHNSAMFGPYQLKGEAKAAGWMSPIPKRYHSLFGGTHITGSQPHASIISRLSIGPAAHAVDLRQEIVYAPTGQANTQTLLEFPIEHFLRDNNVYPIVDSTEDILTNKDLKNKLWTSLSGAAYGVIIPETRTYLTIGKSAGHYSGIGYKITQDTGRQCPGPCPHVASDQYSYYWLWDLLDLVKVRLGLKEPYEIRPYDYGIFNIPFETVNGISGGAIDRKNNRLIFSLKDEIKSTRYSRTPAFVVYSY